MVNSHVTWAFVLEAVLLNRLVNTLRKEKNEITTFADNAKPFRIVKIKHICEEMQRTSAGFRKCLNIT